MSKNQQKNTFNDASGLLNSFEGTNAADVSGLQNQTAAAGGQYQTALSGAENAYGGLTRLEFLICCSLLRLLQLM